MPPCAEPMLAPMRSCGRPSSPASASASCAAAVASCAQRSMRRESRRPKSASPSKSLTRHTGVGGSPSQLEHAGPRDTVCQGVPERIDANADRAHDPNSGDHDPPAHGLESARCAASAHPMRGCRRTWVYPGTNDRKLPASQQLSGPSPRRSLLQIPPCRPLAADGAATARPLWERTASTPITPETAWLRQRRSGRPDLSSTPTARTATWPRAWTRSEAIRSAIRHSIPPTTA